MDTINVKKTELIEALKKNRDNHRAEFEKALDGWKLTVVEAVEKLYTDAKKGKVQNAYLNLPRPEDHTRDYDRRIQMYEMDIDPSIRLSEQEFAWYVQDDWGWKGQWTTSNTMYMAASSK